jgi:MraZ protein
MAKTSDLILGEVARSLDERFRVSLPAEMVGLLCPTSADCVLAKQRPGCLSLWRRSEWRNRQAAGVDLLREKMRTGRLEGRTDQLQSLGRLLSTRHKELQLAGRGRLLIPEGFREFLGVEPGGELIVLGAAVCVEIWNPRFWLEYLHESITGFERLFDSLTN